MEEPQPKQVTLEIAKVRKRYDEEIVPRQQDALAKIEVAPIEEIIGSGLKIKIDEAFQEPSLYSSELMRKRAIELENYLDPMGPSNDVREVDGYLVRRRSLGENLTSTEIFDYSQGLPSQINNAIRQSENIPEHVFHPHKHLIIADEQSGLGVDLKRLNYKGMSILISARLPLTGHSAGGGFTLLADADEFFEELRLPNGDIIGTKRLYLKKEVAYLHEAGHSYQYSEEEIDVIHKRRAKEPQDLTSHELAEYIVEERNANAFAISAIRRCREQGVDLTKILDLYDLEEALRTYDIGIGHPEAIFSKGKPRPVQNLHQVSMRGFSASRGHIDSLRRSASSGRIR